ncbi:MAG: hypothetical protein A2277_21070 [Desulfobacterales bacterium RIFOXYA12_FULL_46_15]|nr:MAG: hypothetical protein A2277_21070 [Desulfobacterales bacterium RIFOXYA12_FULL_46_15]
MDENRRILIIDDDEGIRETYRGIFMPEKVPDVFSRGRELFGEKINSRLINTCNIIYEPALAENGLQGIRLVKSALSESRPFAVVFIDMKMPGLNGADTSRKIWEIDPDVKIVIVTAYSEYSPEDIIAVTGRDNIFYLRKPFSHEEILQFARALTNEWNLERKRLDLENELKEMNRNLVERVQKQAALMIQSEKMASLGLLAAGVAHEINNPASFINSNLSVAKKYIRKIAAMHGKYEAMESFLKQTGSDTALQILEDMIAFKEENEIKMILTDFEELTDESIEGINRISTIVRDLRNFSRIDETEYEYIDINNAVDSTWNIIQNQFKYNVIFERDYSDLPEFRCYPQKLKQVLMNLLINAGQAIEKKGMIRVSTRMISKGRRESDSLIEICVSDTGCGIPAENLGRLFDPFFTTKPVGKGTGLGLSVAYEIVKAHEGNIKVESEPGKGSVFTVHLPALVR